MKRSRTAPKSFARAVLLTGIGLAAHGGQTAPVQPVDATTLNGFSIRSPAALRTAEGVRFHGWVCRESGVHTQAHIQIDRLNAQGAILASTSHPVSGLNGRDNHCAIFDVPTNWTLAPGDKVLVCAARSDQTCVSKP